MNKKETNLKVKKAWVLWCIDGACATLEQHRDFLIYTWASRWRRQREDDNWISWQAFEGDERAKLVREAAAAWTQEEYDLAAELLEKSGLIPGGAKLVQDQLEEGDCWYYFYPDAKVHFGLDYFNRTKVYETEKEAYEALIEKIVQVRDQHIKEYNSLGSKIEINNAEIDRLIAEMTKKGLC